MTDRKFHRPVGTSGYYDVTADFVEFLLNHNFFSVNVTSQSSLLKCQICTLYRELDEKKFHRAEVAFILTSKAIL